MAIDQMHFVREADEENQTCTLTPAVPNLLFVVTLRKKLHYKMMKFIFNLLICYSICLGIFQHTPNIQNEPKDLPFQVNPINLNLMFQTNVTETIIHFKFF